MGVNSGGIEQLTIEQLESEIAKLQRWEVFEARVRAELEAENAELQAKNKRLQAVVGRLASSKLMRLPQSGCCAEFKARIEYAQNATKGGN